MVNIKKFLRDKSQLLQVRVDNLLVNFLNRQLGNLLGTFLGYGVDLFTYTDLSDKKVIEDKPKIDDPNEGP